MAGLLNIYLFLLDPSNRSPRQTGRIPSLTNEAELAHSPQWAHSSKISRSVISNGIDYRTGAEQFAPVQAKKANPYIRPLSSHPSSHTHTSAPRCETSFALPAYPSPSEFRIRCAFPSYASRKSNSPWNSWLRSSSVNATATRVAATLRYAHQTPGHVRVPRHHQQDADLHFNSTFGFLSSSDDSPVQGLSRIRDFVFVKSKLQTLE